MYHSNNTIPHAFKINYGYIINGKVIEGLASVGMSLYIKRVDETSISCKGAYIISSIEINHKKIILPMLVNL